jgi:hypothetical protein
MADQPQYSEDNRPKTFNTLEGGLVRDNVDGQGAPNTYTRCRNGTPVLPDGQKSTGRSTEPANLQETILPYTLIGRVHLVGERWILFTTNNTYSEIGEYNETTGVYTTMLNDVATIASGRPGMGFKTTNLITGAARRNFDCGFNIYWADALNVNRMLDTQYLFPNPWVQNCVTIASCITCTNTNLIDIEQLRLSPQFSVPCLKLAKSTAAGTLYSGSYQVAVRFMINSIPCTDFVALSNVQSIWAHGNTAGAVVVNISGINDETTVIFPEIEIVVISMVKGQVQAKSFGVYSSTQKTVYIDNLDNELRNIDIKLLPISNPIIDKSDAIYSVSNYLTMVGVHEKPEFNYQPLANQIVAKWAVVEYPEDYYHKGGINGFPMNVGYMRGERYAFYIRWIYTTGDKSASYHIPGLPAGTGATMPSLTGPSPGDGGVTLASGRFAGYSSTEIYPNNQPTVWNANLPGQPQYDLCGLPIRHHEFPDQATFGGTTLSHYSNIGSAVTPVTNIRIMGVFFENIMPPVDNNGVPLPNIQGYEILRAVRNGHEHILAKGQINNMRTYTDSGGQSGVFSNYPYNDLSADPYLSNTVTTINSGTTGQGLVPNAMLYGWRKDMLSFHSPDTVFQTPSLGVGTLDVVMGMTGVSHGQFQTPYKHPFFKVLTDFDSVLGVILGAISTFANVLNAVSGGATNLSLAGTESIPFITPLGVTSMPDGLIAGTSTISTFEYASLLAANLVMVGLLAPLQIRVVQEQILTVIKGLVPGRQFAVQYNSSGFYSQPYITGKSSYPISDYSYVEGQMQSFRGVTINNIYRNNYVILQTANIPNTTVLPVDNSRYILGGSTDFNWNSSHTISSYYAAYTVPQPAQYGQVDSPKQVPISCMQVNTGKVMNTELLFGGDTYVCRYTEENPMFFFNDWLVNAPNDFLYDYRNYINVPYPMFWINNDVVTYDLLGLAHQNRRLDGPLNLTLFYVNNGYFYLFCNGIRDFFVETTMNVGYRDYGDTIQEMFYDPYGFQDINQIFRSDIIKSEPEYRYDQSLSAKNFLNQYLSWGQCLTRDYDPILAYTCYNYLPRRVAYSLPQEEELRKDNWKVFLPNNYKDMPTKVTCIKDINKTGAFILLQDQSPLMFTGIESMPSQNGTEYSIGTGRLFEQTLQSVTNVDDNYQYASSQSRMSVVNTPYGLIWVSQNTGKVFQYAGGQLIDISEHGLKYDLSLFLPSMLLQQFPNFQLYDNPVAGVGVQVIYDSINSLLYICKKDYKAKPGVSYDSVEGFSYCPCPAGFTCSGYRPFGGGWICINNETKSVAIIAGLPPGEVVLGDPLYFDDASWTLSYDLQKKQWISHHDWHPAMNIPAKTHFLTTITDSTNSGNVLWRHNKVTNLFCNYYGIDYPFEIEYPVTTGNNVTTLESIEVFLEAYNYKADQVDRFHVYDNFFNECMVYNSEQATPMMYMVNKPYDDPYNTAGYPFFTSLGVNTYYTKQEQKYRIAMSLRDYSKDRYEFGIGATQLIQTQPNWYTFQLNSLYYDYNKEWDQLKKMRHYKSRIFLRKSIVKYNSMNFYFAKSNMVNSPR